MDILSVKQKFGIIGNNSKINEAIDIALRVSATDLSVLVTGESGVGKEFFPQIIHTNSSRKHSNYIAVNCGAIPEGTIDSELFGHEKGSFTGANESRKGYFEMANGGTIFLDEVAELPQTTQVRLLRVLQTGEYIRVGSSKVQKTNVRVVAATNINLYDAIAKGKFREDLFYRLNTVPVYIPALRDRNEDVYMLFRRFAIDIAQLYSMPAIQLNEEARRVLQDYYWPGNIRQLKNVAEQMSVVEESREITPLILKKYLISPKNSQPMIISNSENDGESFKNERELLFGVLYDIRKEINELKQLVLRMGGNPSIVSQSVDSSITPIVTPPPVSTQLSLTSHVDSYEDVEVVQDNKEMTKEDYMRDEILKTLSKNRGKRKETAKELFISERTLYRRMKSLGIDDTNI